VGVNYINITLTRMVGKTIAVIVKTFVDILVIYNNNENN